MGFKSLLLMSSLLCSLVSASDDLVILAYHHVDTETPASTSISPLDFRGHLEYLRDNGFTVVALDQAISALQTGMELPDRAVAITFDDGYISIYETAFPMLMEFDFPFTLFLSTEPIDNGQRNYLSWDQVRSMSDAGVLIANHMVTHPYMLDRLNEETDEQRIERLENELLEAESVIERETGQSHRYLAYPYGEFDPDIKAMLSKSGFIGIAQNSGAVNKNSDFLALPRFPVASIYANLETAKTKFETYAFDVELVEPASPVTDLRNPSTTLRFSPGNYNQAEIGCFANSKPIPMNWLDRETGLVELNPEETYSGRRWRYICTAPNQDDRTRYFWYSVQWIHTGD